MHRFGGLLAVLLISASLLQSTKAAEDVKGDGLLILAQLGDQRGQISTGQCKCKDQCEVGQSIFSQGRTVAQCERKCQQAFSGCTKGEVRSTQRRDLIAASAPTQDHRRIAASGPAQDHRRNLVECLKEMGLTPDPGLQFEVTIGQDGTQIFFA
ncbi:MAG TPA: hypothetical protein VGP86_14705 [Xanthobacteraceae bacterium]|jgi:hypothetical protein|nr:hypothetical protein [Xanthobacteraceae bacterium]